MKRRIQKKHLHRNIKEQRRQNKIIIAVDKLLRRYLEIDERTHGKGKGVYPHLH